MKIEMNGKKYRAEFDPDHPRAEKDQPVLLLDAGDALIPCCDSLGVYLLEGTEAEQVEFDQWKMGFMQK